MLGPEREAILAKARKAFNEGRVEWPKGAREISINDEEVDPLTAAFTYLRVVYLAPPRDGLQFEWGIDGFGFGEASVEMTEDGQWQMRDEGMGTAFVHRLLAEATKRGLIGWRDDGGNGE